MPLSFDILVYRSILLSKSYSLLLNLPRLWLEFGSERTALLESQRPSWLSLRFLYALTFTNNSTLESNVLNWQRIEDMVLFIQPEENGSLWAMTEKKIKHYEVVEKLGRACTTPEWVRYVSLVVLGLDITHAFRQVHG